jgi:hypothetical protein
MSTPRLPQTATGMNVSAVALKIDGLELLFRQSDIRALESASEVDGNDPGEGSIGWVGYMRQRWPVYCLSNQLELLSGMPPSRRTCALLALDTGYFGMLCDDATILKRVAEQVHEVPVAMKNADTPILGLLPAGDKLLCISAPNHLAAYIARQVRKPSLHRELPCLA